MSAQTGHTAGLATATDAGGNFYITLKGHDPEKDTFLIASHLDAVPQGGNECGGLRPHTPPLAQSVVLVKSK